MQPSTERLDNNTFNSIIACESRWYHSCSSSRGNKCPGLHIHRACLARAYISISWRDMKAVFIAKPGKLTYTDTKSLTSFLLKGLKRLVYRYIWDTCILRCLLHCRQHAYQEGKSTKATFHEHMSKIEKSMYEKKTPYTRGHRRCLELCHSRRFVMRQDSIESVSSYIYSWKRSTHRREVYWDKMT